MNKYAESPLSGEEYSFLHALVGRPVVLTKMAINRGLSRCPVCSIWTKRLGNYSTGQAFVDLIVEHLRRHVERVPEQQRNVLISLVAMGNTPYHAWSEATGETDWKRYWRLD